MIIPDGTRSDDYVGINWGGAACDKFKQLLLTNERLQIFFEWFAKLDGTLQTTFLDELNRWEYGTLASTSASPGLYSLTSDPKYAAVRTSLVVGRMVMWEAVAASPATGSTLNLDGIGAQPLLNLRGQPIQEDEIKIGQVVVAVWSSTAWRAISQLSLSQLFVVPSRSYAKTTKPGNSNADFPCVMTITLTKVAGQRWDYIDLNVFAHMVGESNTGGTARCAIKFTSGPLSGSPLSAVTGINNLDQRFDWTFADDTTQPHWQANIDVPPAYQTENSIEFEATITLSDFYGDGPLLAGGVTDTTEHFIGIAHNLTAAS